MTSEQLELLLKLIEHHAKVAADNVRGCGMSFGERDYMRRLETQLRESVQDPARLQHGSEKK